MVARSAFRAVDPSLGDVAATLGHGLLARFLRADVPAASDGLRIWIILMWLLAFGEYGTVATLAYHPYSLPVYVDNLFSSAPLSQPEAPTALAFDAGAGSAIIALAVPSNGRLSTRVKNTTSSAATVKPYEDRIVITRNKAPGKLPALTEA